MKITVDYSALAASAPINQDAALARDGGGFNYAPNKRITNDHWDAPQPTLKVPHGCPDLTGKKVGKLTVLGYLGGGTNGGNKSRWLVRCLCGQYESRRGKAINNPANTIDCCQVCRHTLFLKRESAYLATGKDKPITEYF